MQAERDELAKHVFPELRHACGSRRVVWADVDLRWGVTDEQRADGRVLPICLEEIRNCHPFFLGLLGDRYGCDDFELAETLLEAEPWLAEHPGCSITELEMLCGALEAVPRPQHAFFYLRSPEYLASLPAERRALLSDGPRPGEVEAIGRREAERRAARRRERLAELKERVRSSGFTVRDYQDPRHLGELIRNDLTAVIDRLFPAARTEDDEVEREAHEAAMWNLAEVQVKTGVRHGVYVVRREAGNRLDEHGAGSGPPLVVTGPAGIGKSALLANWWLRWRQAHERAFGFVHVVGATPSSSSALELVDRLIRALGSLFGGGVFGRTLVDGAPLLQVFLAVAAERAGPEPMVLVIDGLDRLEDHSDELDLEWLPRSFPPGVRVIVSAAPGRAFNALRRRGWPALTVAPLQADERRALVERYLAVYRKTLDAHLAERLTQPEATGLPSFLLSVLDEIRLLGRGKELAGSIEHYLEAATPEALFDRILARFERDYERDRPGLVGDALRALWAARTGLADAELLAVLGDGEQPLPMAHWAPLRRALGRSLLDRGGLIAFAVRHFRDAVAARYLGDEDERARAHARLADHFARRLGDPRSIEELPWQLEQSGQWARLREVLSDDAYLSGMGISDEYAVRRMWAGIERHTSAAARNVVDEGLVRLSKLNVEMLATLEGLAWSSGDYARAREILDELLRRSEPGSRAAAYLMKQSADVHLRLGHPRTALDLLDRARELFAGRNDAAGEADCLRSEGAYWASVLEFEKALSCAERALAISRKSGDRHDLRADLTNVAAFSTQLGRIDEVRTIHREEEEIARELEDWDGLARSLNNQANLELRFGDRDRALALFTDAADLSTRFGNARSLAIALAGQASAGAEGAFELSQRARRLAAEAGDAALVAHCIHVQAALFDQFSEEERARVVAELGEHRPLADAFRQALEWYGSNPRSDICGLSAGALEEPESG
jgi:tetratricopeptide (TPR) repeat protein